MQNLPDADEAAEFSEVLKSFYKVVYEDHDEQLPAILKVFKEEKTVQKIKIKGQLKSNRHHEQNHENLANGYIEVPNVNGAADKFSENVNGFPHQDSLVMKGFPYRESSDLRNEGTYALNGLEFSNGVNPVLIISPDEFKEAEKKKIEDSGFQNGQSEGIGTEIAARQRKMAFKQSVHLTNFRQPR